MIIRKANHPEVSGLIRLRFFLQKKSISLTNISKSKNENTLRFKNTLI
jgi:hypothetical protein